MPSYNTYHLTWVSLTLGVGYLFTAAPAKCSHCSLPWMRGNLLTAAPPDLERGLAPLGPHAPAQPLLLTLDEGYLLTAAPPDLEHGVAPLGPPAPAQPPLLVHGVAPLGRCP